MSLRHLNALGTKFKSRSVTSAGRAGPAGTDPLDTPRLLVPTQFDHRHNGNRTVCKLPGY